MASRLSLRLGSRLLRNAALLHSLHPSSSLHHPPLIFSVIASPSFRIPPASLHHLPFSVSALRLLSTAARRPTRPKKVDIGARARQLQTRRLWAYALTFSCIAGFIVLVLNNFQDQLVFYLTPTDALEKFAANPSKNKFRLGGLVLEGSVATPASSPDIEFVITDLMTDILVRYQGSLPDLFREGHSVVVEGFVKPLPDDIRNAGGGAKGVSDKARSGDCYFAATEVLAKHDEKYMPKEVGEAIEKNKKKLLEMEGAATAAKDTPPQQP